MTEFRDLTPRVGLTVRYQNEDDSTQTFRCIRIATDRAPARAIWRSRCSVCGSTFTIGTPARARTVKHRQGGLYATRCNECRTTSAGGDR